MSKNIKRDEKGHVILPGAVLYRYSVKPKPQRPNTTDLKNQAANRLAALMKDGSRADRLACPSENRTDTQEKRAMDFQREFADSPLITQFAHRNNKLQDLRDELKELEEKGNRRKLEFMKPIIEREIAEQEEEMRDLYREIKNERRIVLKVVRTDEK